MSMHPLRDEWQVWFKQDKDSWDPSSYVRVLSFHTVESMHMVLEKLPEFMKCGNLYIMKSSIFPSWDCKENAEGSRITFKQSTFLPVSQHNLDSKWRQSTSPWENFREVVYAACGGYLRKCSTCENDCGCGKVNGLEIQFFPPRVKIWLSDHPESVDDVISEEILKLVVELKQGIIAPNKVGNKPVGS